MAALKYSRQRESIKEFLRSRTDHPTADTVYENLRQIYPNISLMCTKCNRVIDMQSDSLNGILEQAAAEFVHGKVFDVDASFYGICKECLKKEEKQS